MASEFGILMTNEKFDPSLEKTICDVIVTKKGRVKHKEVDGVCGYEWDETNHRFGLCEVEHDMSISEFMYNEIRCEGAYPIFPRYIIDTLKYEKFIDRNDHQIRVDRDDNEMRKILIQPYAGEMYFSPECYPSVFLRREARSQKLDRIRNYIGKRVEFYEEESKRKAILDQNKMSKVEQWRDAVNERIVSIEPKRGECYDHGTDIIYQFIKKLRFGMMYPHYYVLHSDYCIVPNKGGTSIGSWHIRKRTEGDAKASAMYSGKGPLNDLRVKIERDDLSRETIIQIIEYGKKFNSSAGDKQGNISIEKLVEYCDFLTTFVHAKKKEEGEDDTARQEIRKAWVKGMPYMDFSKPMKITRGFNRNMLFFAALDSFRKRNGVDVDPNKGKWKEHIKEVTEKLKKAQTENGGQPCQVSIDGVNVLTNVDYGTVNHWIDWVTDIIMVVQTKRLVKEYAFKKLKSENLLAGMNSLVGVLRCYMYCLALAIYDFYEGTIDGFKKGSNASAIIETVAQMFPDFRRELVEKFGIDLRMKEITRELFVGKSMTSKFMEEGEYGYKFAYGWRRDGFAVMEDYGEILTEKVEDLYKGVLLGRKWEDEVDDPESYFYDDLYTNEPHRVFLSAGKDVDNNITLRSISQAETTYLSKRFVSYWYRISQVEVTKARNEVLDMNEKQKPYFEFEYDDFKPCSIGELGIHASTYIYQNLLVGRNRGEEILDSKELVWMDMSLLNFGAVRSHDRCWISSSVAIEVNLRHALIVRIFSRFDMMSERETFSTILEKVMEDVKELRFFPTYRHYYLETLQRVFNDERRLEVDDFYMRLYDVQTREQALNTFTDFHRCVESELLLPTLKLNFLLWIVFEMENVEVNAAYKRHPLLISTAKGLRVIGVDIFNSQLSISMSGWIPYVERMCAESKVQTKLTADELKLKRWFISYYTTLKLDRRAEPRMSFKFEGLSTWIGSNCGGVRDYVIQMLPTRKPKPGALMVVYARDSRIEWIEAELSQWLQMEGSLGLILVHDSGIINKSVLRARTLKIYNRGSMDTLILISSGVYTFGNKFLLSKLLAKTE
ncbi:VP2 [Orbivirus alphaequi]|uniref:Outer capsid protein VP2 n=2 Tax=African horse sickness virus TaxID=40050 RepID=I3RK63_AHSV|nr:VP2 [African horse sickness virus]AHZ12847.1 VP2 [African horse sickness virus]AJC11316.1 VP2 [African horse sickness virus]AKP19766.1 VP2 [African horse sickness virus 4]ALA10629.1 major outer capsid protein [African horse sickness virus 4]